MVLDGNMKNHQDVCFFPVMLDMLNMMAYQGELRLVVQILQSTNLGIAVCIVLLLQDHLHFIFLMMSQVLQILLLKVLLQ